MNGKTRYVHRLAFEERYGHLPEVVRHKCDNPSCYNPDHLEPGTQADNVRDMMERDREVRGERARNSILTEAQVREILEAVRAKSETQVSLARRFGVSKQAINHVVKGRSWKKTTAKSIGITGT